MLSVFASHLLAFANFIERCFTFMCKKTTLLPVGPLTKHRIRLAKVDGCVESSQQHFNLVIITSIAHNSGRKIKLGLPFLKSYFLFKSPLDHHVQHNCSAGESGPPRVSCLNQTSLLSNCTCRAQPVHFLYTTCNSFFCASIADLLLLCSADQDR